MTRIYTTKHRGRCAVDCRKAARRVDERDRASQIMKERGTTLWQTKLALRFHIPSQARSHGNVNLEPRITQMDTDNRITQGNAQVTCAGASGPHSLASKLADAPVSESLTRSASGPAFSRFVRDEEIAKNWRPEKTRSRPGLPGWRFF